MRKNYAVGRLNEVSPKDTERFHLKLILNRIKGATSFEDLPTYENVTYNTYKETAIVMGLAENSQQIFETFDEGCSVMLPSQLRKYFALSNSDQIKSKFSTLQALSIGLTYLAFLYCNLDISSET